MRITLDLSEKDLKHFRLIMQQAQSACEQMTEKEIVAAAQRTLEAVNDGDVPDFIRDRIEQLQPLVGMLTDGDWGLPQGDRDRVLHALAYFSDPDDLIPDEIPGVGYLDDAIMVELVAAELAEELDSYNDFCRYREETSGDDHTATRSDWLKARRLRNCKTVVRDAGAAARSVCSEHHGAGRCPAGTRGARPSRGPAPGWWRRTAAAARAGPSRRGLSYLAAHGRGAGTCRYAGRHDWPGPHRWRPRGPCGTRPRARGDARAHLSRSGITRRKKCARTDAARASELHIASCQSQL